MKTKEINEHYIKLCKSMNLSVNVKITDEKNCPIQQIQVENDSYTVLLNMHHISEDEYTTYLTYNIGKILLPRLYLKTERLILRRFQLEDANDCFTLMSDPEGCYMDCCKPFFEMDAEYEKQMALFAEREGQYVIALRENGKVIGIVHVFDDSSRAVETKEIGYSISPTYRRQGYAFEALTALIDLLQNELYVELITAGVLAENTASMCLLEKLNFQKEGFKRKCIWHEGLNKPVDLIYYYKDK